jgi:hypothetical protein
MRMIPRPAKPTTMRLRLPLLLEQLPMLPPRLAMPSLGRALIRPSRHLRCLRAPSLTETTAGQAASTSTLMMATIRRQQAVLCHQTIATAGAVALPLPAAAVPPCSSSMPALALRLVLPLVLEAGVGVQLFHRSRPRRQQLTHLSSLPPAAAGIGRHC